MINLFESSCWKFYDGAAAQLALGLHQEASDCAFAARQALLYQVFGLGNVLWGGLEFAKHISSYFLIRLSCEANLDDLAAGFCKLCRQGGLWDFLLFIIYISVVHGRVKDALIDANRVIIVKFIIA